MMKILFRGKCIDETCLKGKWLEGQILHDGVAGKHYIHWNNCLNESDNVGEEGLLRFVAYEVDPETVCQYTGLPDKTGKKIFNGDIIISDGTIGIVKFGKYKNGFHYGFYVEWTSCPLLRQELGFWNDRSEIIGNIFDNPELIKERKEDTYGEME